MEMFLRTALNGDHSTSVERFHFEFSGLYEVPVILAIFIVLTQFSRAMKITSKIQPLFSHIFSLTNLLHITIVFRTKTRLFRF